MRHRGGFGKVPSAGASSPWSWVGSPLWHMDMFTLQLHNVGVLMESWSARQRASLAAFSALLLLIETWGQGWSFPACNHGLVLLVTIHHPEAIQELLSVTSLYQRYSCNPGNYKGFRRPVSGTRGRDQCGWFFFFFFLLLHSGCMGIHVHFFRSSF